MDIRSLLSPQDAASPESVATSDVDATTHERRRARPQKLVKKPSEARHASSTSSGSSLTSDTPGKSLSRDAVSPAQSMGPPPLPTNTSSQSVAAVDSVPYQTSSPGMDTLADLASMQLPQGPQSTQQNLSQPLTKSEAASRLRASSFDMANTDAAGLHPHSPPPRTYDSAALSSKDLLAANESSATLAQNPFAYQAYVDLIGLLRKGVQKNIQQLASSDSPKPSQQIELSQDLETSREAFHQRFAVGEGQWVDWINDRITQANGLEGMVALRELCEKAVQEEPNSTSIWLAYAQWMLTEHRKVAAHKGNLSAAPDRATAEGEQEMLAEIFSWQQALSVWRRAVAATMWRINDSHQLWNDYTELLIQDIGMAPKAEDVTRLQKWYMERLQIPHAQWVETSQNLSTFVSTWNSAEWEEIMVTANSLGQDAKFRYNIREGRELAISSAEQAGDREAELAAFNDYLDYEVGLNRKKRHFSFDMTNALYGRATLRFPDRDDLWEAYIMFLHDEVTKYGNHSISILSVSDRANRHCPWSGQLWAQTLLEAEIARIPFTEISDVKHRATSAGLLELGDMNEVLKVTTAWCGFLRRRAFMPGSSDEETDVAEVGIRSAIEDLDTTGRKKYGKSYQGDPQYRLEKIYIRYLTQCRNFNAARDQYKKLIKKRGHDYDFWLRYYVWEMNTFSKTSYPVSDTDHGNHIRPVEATKVLRQAIQRTDLDWPEKLLETYIYHCEDHEDATQLQAAVSECYTQKRRLQKKREYEAQTQQYNQSQNILEGQVLNGESSTIIDTDGPDHLGKRKRDEEGREAPSKKTRPEDALPTEAMPTLEIDANDDVAAVKRDRENATITVRNLPEGTTETKVRQYFRDCGTINSLKLTTEVDKNTMSAVIEFETKEDVLSAQTRDQRDFDGNTIDIHVTSGTTLYICNFTPIADDQWIRSKFSQFGDILDVRLPSLKYNTHRRFAYVQYKTPAEAHAALVLDEAVQKDGLKLSVKISDPSNKQARQGPIHEGREVFVVNVPWSAGWKDLKQHFASCGSVESARVPRKLDGSHKGIGFVVFRHQKDVPAALAKHHTEWNGRTINVTLSTNDVTKRQILKPDLPDTRTSASPAPSNSLTNGHTHHSASPPPSTSLAKKAEIQSRTIALLGVPDTVNDARIRALAEPYGDILRVSLRPNHSGAIVEFADQSSVGTASLALAGYEIAAGRQLQIGTVDDMKRLRPEFRTDKIGSQKATALLPVTNIVRRPGQNVARRGGKGGLGFKRKVESKDAHGAETVQQQPGGVENSKTNADFKAMITD